MSLASLVDKPLMQNPLAGGGAPQIIDPSVLTPRGGAPETDDPIMQGFFDSEFYNPRSTTNVVNYKFRGKDMQGSGSQASDLKKYLESIGQGNLIELSNESIAQQGSGPLATMEKNPYGTEFIGLGADQTNLFGYKVPDEIIKAQEEKMKNNPIDMSGILRPGMPGYTPLAPIKEGVSQDVFGNPNILAPNPMQTGDQGLMDRLTSLEQGIGSLQNQIASLFQMGQASDPFGLGGFMNTRRY